MNNINSGSRILSVCRREFQRIAANKPMWLMTIILPILTFIFVAFIYQKGSLRDIPVVIYDGDNSEISRLISRSMDASPAMKIVKRVSSIAEIEREMQKGNAYGGLYIPDGFESSLKGGNKTTVVFYKYSYNLVIGTNLLKESSTIIKTISGGVLLKKLRSKGMSAEQAMSVINPISIESQSLFNPAYNYEEYLVPGVIPFLFQIIIMLGALWIIGSEFTGGTL
ncbi:MAG TPA: ABC transporter permease, partial [Ignavibacteriales bacterium]|nr:ABC transporter permease [Ignavibacteriales bacterium]